MLNGWKRGITAVLVILVTSVGVASAAPDYAQVIDPTSHIFSELYQQVSPSVVAINVTLTSRRGRVIGSATGSGFVIDQQGHIVTNDHVVNRASEIEVEFFDGTLAAAEVVGLDPSSDLAVLSVDLPAEQLIPVQFGDSDTLLVGDTVMAIGSPYGQDWTLTTGIISGVNRVISGLTDFSIGGVIQTDAAINPGNSGGPLLNLEGHIVGVNSQIFTQTGSSSGVGFAIPSNLVQRVAHDLIESGTVDYSYLGVSGLDITLHVIDALDLPAQTRGVLITQMDMGSPAAKAGVQNAAVTVGQTSTDVTNFDIITAMDGTPIKNMNELISFLARKTLPGQTITLTILRNGSETVSLPVKLTVRP